MTLDKPLDDRKVVDAGRQGRSEERPSTGCVARAEPTVHDRRARGGTHDARPRTTKAAVPRWGAAAFVRLPFRPRSGDERFS